MIVPQYWAEARAQGRIQEHQVTVRRFGWSDGSQEEAQTHAETRAREALARLESGEKLPRRERKVPYNGADGMPIREEIVSRHGDVVITRNSYGARCLNTPDVLFADVDFEEVQSPRSSYAMYFGIVIAAAVIGIVFRSKLMGILAFVALLYFGPRLFSAASLRLSGSPQERTGNRLQDFLRNHPAWRIRVYRTPSGRRLLAMHQTYDPSAPEVSEFFKAVGADRLYVRMCLNQHCFRARVSGKPWRMGISEHMRPRPGVWPVQPERLDARRRWIEQYEAKAAGFAACAFVEEMGDGPIHEKARTVQALHDEMCRAGSALPLA